MFHQLLVLSVPPNQIQKRKFQDSNSTLFNSVCSKINFIYTCLYRIYCIRYSLLFYFEVLIHFLLVKTLMLSRIIKNVLIVFYYKKPINDKHFSFSKLPLKNPTFRGLCANRIYYKKIFANKIISRLL